MCLESVKGTSKSRVFHGMCKNGYPLMPSWLERSEKAQRKGKKKKEDNGLL